jgi:hypothetical protein
MVPIASLGVGSCPEARVLSTQHIMSTESDPVSPDLEARDRNSARSLAVVMRCVSMFVIAVGCDISTVDDARYNIQCCEACLVYLVSNTCHWQRASHAVCVGTLLPLNCLSLPYAKRHWQH